ncbi:MAG: glutamate-5-semialdehyde dehydrogenase [Roseiflexaceae bacterium]
MSITIEAMGRRARAAGRRLGLLSTAQKVAALDLLAQALCDNVDEILEANAKDLEQARAAGISAALLDRMMLNQARLIAIANDVRQVAQLPDPVGEQFDAMTLPNGLRIHKRRVPFGVVGVIYEARPNVTVDVAALCLKSGNAAILRGGKEIANSCAAITKVISRALATAGLPADAIQVIDNPDRSLVEQLLKLDRYVDVIIPRGGAGLHRFCVENSTIPVIVGGIGVCHLYVDKAADPSKVNPILYNGKVQRPSVCNSLDTLLIHQDVAEALLPAAARTMIDAGVELRCDEQSLALLQSKGVTSLPNAKIVPAQAGDFGTEFMALILSIRVVESIDSALDHIAEYGNHSDAIITEDPAAADLFIRSVDSAGVFVNASTRFNDGGQLGLGAEIAVSTQKLHARGPMALYELTTYKWVVEGDGQIRA